VSVGASFALISLMEFPQKSGNSATWSGILPWMGRFRGTNTAAVVDHESVGIAPGDREELFSSRFKLRCIDSEVPGHPRERNFVEPDRSRH
jgi:hypothetical protein